MSAKLSNFLVFQLGWLMCVLAGGSAWHLIGTLVVVAAVVFNLLTATNPRQQFTLIILAVVIGFVWDSLLASSGLTRYQYGQVYPGLAPHWIIALWALFATTLNLSMRWLRNSLLLATLFGAVGGPLAYYAGERLGSVSFSNPTESLLVLALGWALITPLLVYLSIRFDGFAPQTEPGVG